MAVTEKKKAIVAELKDKLTSAKGAVLVSYKGLTVAQDTELRSELRKAGVNYHVVKNTMTRIAATEAGMEDLVSLCICNASFTCSSVINPFSTSKSPSLFVVLFAVITINSYLISNKSRFASKTV